MQLLACHTVERVVEGALHAQQVHPLDIGEETLVVGGVGAIGIAADGVLAAGFLLDKIAVGGDGMEQREGIHAAQWRLEKQLDALGERELVVVELKLDMAPGDLHQQVHSVADAGGSVDVDRLLTPAEVHAAHQSGEPEEMVAVEVGEADVRDALHLLVIDAELGLGVLAAVEEHPEAVDVHHLSAAVAGDSRQCGTGAEYGRVEIHLMTTSYNLLLEGFSILNSQFSK